MRVCRVCTETKRIKGRGLCSGCYNRMQRHGRLREFQKGRRTAAVLEWLQLDGSWMTSEAIAMERNVAHSSVARQLYRLHKDGEVEKRTITLGRSLASFPDSRVEWRAASVPEHWRAS